MKKNNHNKENYNSIIKGQPFENMKNDSTSSLSNLKSVKNGSQWVNSKLSNLNDARVMKDDDGNFDAAEKEIIQKKHGRQPATTTTLPRKKKNEFEIEFKI